MLLEDPAERDHRRRVTYAVAAAHLSAPRPPIRHAGPCGPRAYCPRGCNPLVRTLERLGEDVVVHCPCRHAVLAATDPEHAEYAAVFP